jgi:translation initiation factor IF-1
VYLRGRIWQADGTVTEVLAASFFRVQLDEGPLVTCRPSGKLALRFVTMVAGDRVVCEGPLEGERRKARIVWRYDGYEM